MGGAVVDPYELPQDLDASREGVVGKEVGTNAVIESLYDTSSILLSRMRYGSLS